MGLTEPGTGDGVGVSVDRPDTPLGVGEVAGAAVAGGGVPAGVTGERIDEGVGAAGADDGVAVDALAANVAVGDDVGAVAAGEAAGAGSGPPGEHAAATARMATISTSKLSAFMLRGPSAPNSSFDYTDEHGC